MSNSIHTLEVGRWYRFPKPDDTFIELLLVGSGSFRGRAGTMYDQEIIRELHASKPVVPLERDPLWP